MSSAVTLKQLAEGGAEEVVAAKLIAEEVRRHRLQLQRECGSATMAPMQPAAASYLRG
jgi:hypothetical protein